MTTTLDLGHPDHHAWQRGKNSRIYRCLCGLVTGKPNMMKHLEEVEKMK